MSLSAETTHLITQPALLHVLALLFITCGFQTNKKQKASHTPAEQVPMMKRLQFEC